MAEYPQREYIVRETEYPMGYTKDEEVGELVRCKDCKHSPLKTWFECPLAHLRFDGDRWCWKGEREDDEQHD